MSSGVRTKIVGVCTSTVGSQIVKIRNLSIYLYDINRRIKKAVYYVTICVHTCCYRGHAKHVLLMSNLSPPGRSIRMKGFTHLIM